MIRIAEPRVAWILALLLLLAARVHAQTPDARPSIQGRILDSDTLAPIHLVEVTLIGLDLRAVTDRDGRFVLQNIRPGSYTLRALHVGYEALVREDVPVEAGPAQELELNMAPRGPRLEEVIVTPGAYTFIETDGTARQTMSREEIEEVPQLAEDIFRAVTRLPGLTSGDYAAHFSIRGGRHDETLILLDRLELYEPYHLKDFNEGAISIIDTEMVEGVELMTGGFSAMYGNKRSGVFSIQSRRPKLDRAQYSLGISFLNARAMAMGPLQQGKGSWLVSGRSGYMDLVFKMINQDELPSPRYHDLFGKLQFELGSNNILSFEALHAGDSYTFDAESTTGFLDSLQTREFAANEYGNSYVWGTLNTRLGAGTTVRSMLSAGLVTRFRDGSERYVERPDPVYELTNERDFSIFGFRQDWSTILADWYVLSYGLDLRRLRSTDSITSAIGQDPNDPSEDPDAFYPVITNTRFEQTGQTAAVYLSNRWRLLKPLVVDVGARYDHASYTRDDDISPRVNAALRLAERTTLRAGWGQYRQIQGIDDVAVLDGDTSYFPSELTIQYTAGLEQQFANGAVFRLDAYVKEGSDLRPVYRNWKGGIDVFPETNEDRILVFPRETLTKGVEVYYDQRFGRRSAVRASYIYAIADEKVDRIENVNGSDELVYDAEHPWPQDQRHTVNLDLMYRLSQLWTITAAFTYHSGWPATLENLVPVVDDQGNPDFTPKPDEIYGDTLPSYQRLDLRITRRWATSRGDFRAYLALVNVTNHENIFGYDYFKSADGNGGFTLEREDETWFTILPSLGVSWNGLF